MSQQKQTIKLEFPKVVNSIDLPVGTTFKIGKVQYQVVLANMVREADACDGCMMSLEYCPCFLCTRINRRDRKQVSYVITNLEEQL